ncbi:MAG: archease [Candidatus Omnitrophota bacterium]
MKHYEIIDHTADIGLRARGKDLKELFAHAAYGMFEIMADLKNVQAKKTIPVNLKAPNVEELFLSWLGELLYLYNSKKLILNSFTIDTINETSLSARAGGETLNLKKHRLKMEIKAATFHNLLVRKQGRGWQGEVIFDV